METDKEMGVVHDNKQRNRAAVKHEEKAKMETQNFKIRVHDNRHRNTGRDRDINA